MLDYNDNSPILLALEQSNVMIVNVHMQHMIKIPEVKIPDITNIIKRLAEIKLVDKRDAFYARCLGSGHRQL